LVLDHDAAVVDSAGVLRRRRDVSDWFDGNGSGASVDALKLLDSKAGEGVHALVGAGALVSLGLTSDGGALGVTVTVDGRYRREYFRSEDDLEAWVAEALPAVIDARGGNRPSGVPGNGSRRRTAR
jgi:hypothetical protein